MKAKYGEMLEINILQVFNCRGNGRRKKIWQRRIPTANILVFVSRNVKKFQSDEIHYVRTNSCICTVHTFSI